MTKLLKTNLPLSTLQQALESWRWRPRSGSLVPVTASLFGDLFLSGPRGWWFLDVIAGSLTPEWDSQAECWAQLATPEGRERFLRVGLVQQAQQVGMELEESDVYGFTVPPMFDAPAALDNMHPYDFLAVHTVMGQLHHHAQTQPISEVRFLTVDGRLPSEFGGMEDPTS